MGRKQRIWHPNLAYHVTSRGNQKSTLFYDDLDFRIFFKILDLAAEKYPFEMYAYCLMTNHFHLLLSTQEVPIWKLMSWVNKGYARYFNTRYGLTGHVFEKRYYSEVVEEGYGIVKVSQYIHLNPVEANIVQHPAEYRWSSYGSYGENPRKIPFPVHTNRVLDNFLGDDHAKRSAYELFVEEDVLDNGACHHPKFVETLFHNFP